MSKNIEINYKLDVGYEALYPNTMLNLVLDWQENLYSKDEILDSATKALYGLGEDSVPKDVFQWFKSQGPNILMEVGEYKGTDTYGSTKPNTLVFPFLPQLVIVAVKQELDDPTRVTYNWCYKAIFIQGTKHPTYTKKDGNGADVEWLTAIWSENELQYYSNETAGRQMNDSTGLYGYVGFGFVDSSN